MGQWTDYFRIVKPRSPRKDYVEDNGSSALYNNYSWYTKAIKNASSRFSKYQQYNNMDNDVDVARALDTIAEEMTPQNTKTKMPFEIVYQNEENKEVDETLSMTIRAALRHFVKIQSLNSETYEMARALVKFGDAFYRKRSDLKKWVWLDPLEIIGVVINDENEIVSYQLRKGNNTSGGFAQVELVPAAGIVHFSLASTMTDGNPFGESVLRAAIKAYKQLSMLEDSILIYRIVRAPERRVFFIDIGNMPAQKAKAYLEAVKNDVKQKRIPNESGGAEKVDSVMNPMSMVEDYYFAQTANGRGSRVETLSGGESLGEIADLNYFYNRFLKGLRIPSSYMRGLNAEGAQIQDGKVGLAYFEEQKFATYVKRLQDKMNTVFDKQFKAFLKSISVKVDENLFQLELCVPQNFSKYKDAAIYSDLLNNFSNVKDVPYISNRNKLKLFLCWNEDDIQANEAQLRQELNIPEGGIGEKLSDLRMMYDPKWFENRPDIKVPDDFDKVDVPKPEGEEEAPPEGEGEEGAPPEGEGEEGAPPEEGGSEKEVSSPDELEGGGKEGSAEKEAPPGPEKEAKPKKKAPKL
jgi:hypothetical protein